VEVFCSSVTLPSMLFVSVGLCNYKRATDDRQFNCTTETSTSIDKFVYVIHSAKT